MVLSTWLLWCTYFLFFSVFGDNERDYCYTSFGNVPQLIALILSVLWPCRQKRDNRVYCLALQNLKEQYVEPALIPSTVSYFLSSLAFWCPNLMYKLLNHLRLSSILIGERCTEAQSPLERKGTRRSPLSPFEQEAQLFI